MTQTKYWIVSNNRSARLCGDEQSARHYCELCEKSYDELEQQNIRIFAVDLSKCLELPVEHNRDNQIEGFLTVTLGSIPMRYRDGFKIKHLKTGWTINYKSYEMAQDKPYGENRYLSARIILNKCISVIHEKYPDVLFRFRVNKEPYATVKPE